MHCELINGLNANPKICWASFHGMPDTVPEAGQCHTASQWWRGGQGVAEDSFFSVPDQTM